MGSIVSLDAFALCAQRISDTSADQYTSPSLEIYFWTFNHYKSSKGAGPGTFIPVEGTISQAARVPIAKYPRRETHEEADESERRSFPAQVWATVGQTRSVITL